MFINALYQFVFYGMLGTSLAQATSFIQAFPLLISKLFAHPQAAHIAQGICNCAIASSALGGAYGIMFSNSWNLYTLAEHGHIFKSNWFVRFNRYQIPALCILAEGLLSYVYLVATQAHQTSLQQITALACTIAYTLSICGLIAYNRTHGRVSIISMLALVNCLALFVASVKSMYTTGFNALAAFATIVLIGICMYFITKNRPQMAQ